MIDPVFSAFLSRSRTGPRSHITNILAKWVSNSASAATSSTLKPRAANASPTLSKIARSASIRPGECANSRKMPQRVLAAFMRCQISAFTTKSRRFGRRDVACPVNVEHARQNDATNRLVLSNEPAEVVAKPGETGRGRGLPLGRQPIEACGHMGTMTAAELPNTAVRDIQRGPQRIFVIDMIGQAERDGVFRKICGRFYKSVKIVDWHDGLDLSDNFRRSDQAADVSP